MLASVNTSVDRSKLKSVGTLRDPVCTQIANAKTNRAKLGVRDLPPGVR